MKVFVLANGRNKLEKRHFAHVVDRMSNNGFEVSWLDNANLAAQLNALKDTSLFVHIITGHDLDKDEQKILDAVGKIKPPILKIGFELDGLMKPVMSSAYDRVIKGEYELIDQMKTYMVAQRKVKSEK